MISPAEVLAYIEYYMKRGNSSVYLHPLDIIPIQDKLNAGKISGVYIIQDPNMPRVESQLDELGLKRKEFIGSLPTEKIGKWLKTN